MPDQNPLDTLAADGRKVAAQTNRLLEHIGVSTQVACEEMMGLLQSALTDENVPKAVQGQLQNMMNVLQYQDVVAQQVSAGQALLVGWDEKLAPFADRPDEADLKVDVAGAFDATASFDRDRVDDVDLDAWIQNAKDDADT